MLPILAALLSGLAFVGMQLVFKQHLKRQRHSSPHPFLIPSWLGFLCPIWALLIIAGHASGHLQFHLAPSALAFPFFWALCTVSTTTLLVWLLSKFSLSELASYKKALITLGALAADMLLFQLHFPAVQLIAIGLLLCGALLLSRTRARLPNRQEITILVLWAAIIVLQITLYKEGQHQQPSVLSFTVLAQFMSTALYSLLWLNPHVAKQQLPWRTVSLVLVCAFAGVALEGFAYAGLPLAAVMVLTILPATLFAAHDLYAHELRRHPQTYLALAGIAGGFLLLVLGK